MEKAENLLFTENHNFIYREISYITITPKHHLI